MPRFQVRDGEHLALNGDVHEAGAVVELPRHVARDHAVAGLVQEVDAAGQPIASPPPDDLERFRAHERVTILRERLQAARDTVAALEAQLAREEQAVEDAVKAARKPKTTKSPGDAPVKE